MSFIDLCDFKIPLPPLEEQKKIAYVLSTVQDAIEKTQKTIDALKECKKSMIKHLFTYGPVSVNEKNNVELKETEIGKIPKHWEVVRLGEYGIFEYGYTEIARSEKIGPKFLRITDIDLNIGKINWNSVPYCKINDEIFSKYSLRDGDILIARIGATTGKTCIVIRPPKSVFASYLIRFTAKKDKILPSYVYFFSKSTIYWSQMNSNKESKLKKGVNTNQLINLHIPLPLFPNRSALLLFCHLWIRLLKPKKKEKCFTGSF